MEVFLEGLGNVGAAVLVVAVVISLLGVLLRIAGLVPARVQRVATLGVLLGPACLLLAFGLALPAIQTAYLSTTDAGQGFVGLANYAWALSSPLGRESLANTLLWIVVVPAASVLVGMVAAFLVDGLRRQSIPIALIVLPLAMSYVGAGIAWSLVYAVRSPASASITPAVAPSTESSISPAVSLGLDPPAAWLQERPWNTLLLMIIVIWIQSGLALVLLRAALRVIPVDVIEAARIDGAQGWLLVRSVRLPMIRDTAILALAAIMIVSLKVFDIVRTTSNGGFGTQVLANEMYSEAFDSSHAGRGSALAILMLLMTAPFIAWSVMRVRESWTPR